MGHRSWPVSDEVQGPHLNYRSAFRLLRAAVLRCFRFGHSQINNIFFVKNANGEVFTYNMRDVFFEMSLIYLGQAEGIIKGSSDVSFFVFFCSKRCSKFELQTYHLPPPGLITEPTMHVDPFFVNDVKDFMYQSPNRTTGLDLLVLNVHRGRDHGIPRRFNCSCSPGLKVFQ